MSRPRVMLHIIMPEQISGPNSAVWRISSSDLSERFDFKFVTQRFHAGGKLNINLIRDLKRQIEAADPDLVHLTGLQASGLHAVIAARLATKAPILITIRGFAIDSLTISGFQRAVFGLVIEPLTLALCTSFVTVTRAAGRRRVVRLFSRKYLGALHNAAPPWAAAELDSRTRERERRRIGLPSQDFIATVSGRMVTDKGLPTLLEVASRLPLGVAICFVGDGPWTTRIREEYAHLLASGKVIMLGQRSDVRDILQVSDVFLFATLHENLSNALLEAMTLSLPAIATNVGGNPEVILHGQTGFLVEPGDADTMLKYILALRKDPDLLGRMGKRARARIEEAFSQQHIYSELAEIYSGLLRENGKRRSVT